MRIFPLLAGALFLALGMPSSAQSYPLCVSLIDTYSLALADTQGKGEEKWKALVEEGNCASIAGATYVMTLDTYTADGDFTRIAQYEVHGKALYGLRIGDNLSDDAGLFEITYKPDYEHEDQATREWFRNARLTPAAKRRLSWSGCCDNADRFVTTFENTTGTDNWFYYKDGNKVEIPWDTIHFEDDPTMPQQLKVEGVLFIVNGVVACFWPPQTGG